MERTGHCLCGATHYTVTTDAKFGIRCYCSDCRRLSGAGSVAQFAFPEAAVTIEGPLKHHFGTAESGNALNFGFCGDCGSPIMKTTTRAEGLIFVYAGSMENTDGLPSLRPVFEEQRPPWDVAIVT
jgi:hypothetical protein